MKVLHIEKGSLADEIGLQPNDEIISISNEPIRDVIDFQYWAADDLVSMLVERDGEKIIFEIEGGMDGWFGAEFESFKYKSCGNHCIFCFVDQNPAGLRKPLYFKDEDFRLSFLYGNYVTLTNLSQKELLRIAAQRLSPIYISVHAVDTELRKHLLGIRGNDRLLQKITFLAEHEIEMHVQIVLCPGLNDGKYLQQTVDTLSEFYPYVKTIAIVPLGLTKHRRGLEELRTVDKKFALELLQWEKNKSQIFMKKIKSHFIYLADEFYILAEKPLPDAERYEDFSQIENGVGMTRAFLDEFRQEFSEMPGAVSPAKISVVTGTMIAPILQKNIVPSLQKIEGLETEIIPVKNKFYGGGVSVSGLLVGQDIVNELSGRNLGEVVLLPPNCLNQDGLFLDDWTVEKVANKLHATIVQPKTGFLEIISTLKN
ncbi:MAG: DUF512 domain-containing protein [Actinobacteria bacterium]|nr:DUF512 domain-containing protein [Actinomycetota bacterium]